MMFSKNGIKSFFIVLLLLEMSVMINGGGIKGCVVIIMLCLLYFNCVQVYIGMDQVKENEQ